MPLILIIFVLAKHFLHSLDFQLMIIFYHATVVLYVVLGMLSSHHRKKQKRYVMSRAVFTRDMTLGDILYMSQK